MNDFFLVQGVGWEPFSRWVIWRFFLDALWLAIRIAAVSMLLSLVIGVVMAVARLARPRIVRLPATGYVEGFRATPLLLLIFFVYFGSARTPLELGPITAAIIALTLYNSAVIAEIMRAGILSISRGVIEASRALGLTYLQAMRYVAVPMALRRMAPGVVSQLITLFKDTSLASLIGVFELMRSGRSLYDNPTYGNAIEVLTVVAFLYFVPSYILSLIAQRLELGPERRTGQRTEALAA